MWGVYGKGYKGTTTMNIQQGDFVLARDETYEVYGIYEVMSLGAGLAFLSAIVGNETEINISEVWVKDSGNYKKFKFEE